MPSARYIFFTHVDEANFSNVMLEKFPRLRFIEFEGIPENFRFVDNIQSGTRRSLMMCIPENGWQPKFGPNPYVPDRYVITNEPEEALTFQRSYLDNMDRPFVEGELPPSIGDGRIYMGRGTRMTKVEISLRNKVWRLMAKVATSDILAQWLSGPGKPWQKLASNMHWFGHDAVRWAREDPCRIFRGTEPYRPMPE